MNIPLEPVSAPILVVDDDASLRRMLAAGLAQLGYGVEQAGNISEAASRLRAGRYSMLLCDYEMPGGNGLDLLKYVTQVYPELPFVLLTAHDDTTLARDAIANGAADFLCKPIDFRRVARVIEQNWVRVERDRERSAEVAESILTGTIRALVAAVDAKDPHTARHSERVSRIAVRLGEALGLASDRLRVLEFAALLHDVGKIAVPEQILIKPGRLTPQEWEILKQHPIRSGEIVSEVGQLMEVAKIVRHHHERVDGLGYPDGLSGDNIPEFARIITISDAYEALTSNRAYRPALSPRQALEMIRNNLGVQFDERIGTLFLSLYERLDIAPYRAVA